MVEHGIEAPGRVGSTPTAVTIECFIEYCFTLVVSKQTCRA